jgi:hypothetical protein
MLAFSTDAGQQGGAVRERSFSVVAVTLFGEQEVARYPTREQAEWRAKELNEWSERNPRGIIQYVIRRVEEPSEEDP